MNTSFKYQFASMTYQMGRCGHCGSNRCDEALTSDPTHVKKAVDVNK
jgi:hypothetical protein